MLFLCQKNKEFLRDFEACEKCEDKEKCVEYKYELEFKNRESSVSHCS